MDSRHFKLFQQITVDYFAKLAPEEPPELGEPYLAFGEPELGQYTSLVEIGGELIGWVYLTAPSGLLESLLEIHGEPEISARELSNVLAGNASRAFGGAWSISVPVSLTPEEGRRLRLPETSFVVPFRWRGARSSLVVALEEPQQAAAAHQPTPSPRALDA